MKNHLHAVRMAFSRELARHLAARLGESESAVAKALRGIVPVVLCQAIIQTGEGEGKNIFVLLKEVSPAALNNRLTVTEVLGLLGGIGQENSTWAIGERLLGRLFGPRLDELMVFTGGYAGISLTSAKMLMGLVATIQALGLARCVAQEDLNSAQLSTELASAKNLAYSWLPSGLTSWPGYRRREAVRAPHAVWAAELARPYWKLMLGATALFMLSIMVLGRNSSISDTDKAAMRQTSFVNSARGQRLSLAPRDSLQFLYSTAYHSTW